MGGIINVYKYLKGACKEDRARLTSLDPSDRKRSNGHKLRQRRSFPVNITKHFAVRMTEYFHRLPWELVASPSLEKFKSHLEMVLGSEL